MTRRSEILSGVWILSKEGLLAAADIAVAAIVATAVLAEWL